MAQTALANSHGRGLLAAIARRSPSPYFFGGACGPGVDTQPVCAGASVSHGPSRSLTGWGRVFFCGLKRAGRINEQPLQIIHPSSGRRQVSAVTRRRIGSSSLNNETLCNKIFRGGSGQDKILRLRLLRRNNVFFSPYVANRTVHRAEVVLHSRCAPVGSSAPPSGISARAWSRRSPLRRGPNLLGIMRTDRPERESVSSACPQDCSFDLKADDATSSAARPFAVSKG